MTPRPKSKPRRASVGRPGRSGFTLVELMVVMLIVAIVSAAALPVVLPALSHREVSESARILQAALVGARDAAIHADAPRGVRLLPDPNFLTFGGNGRLDGSKVLAANRIVALEPAPDYKEGMVNVRNLAVGQSIPLALPYPGEGPAGRTWPYDTSGNLNTSVLLVEEASTTNDYSPTGPGIRNAPTSWFWNIRLGDRIQIGGTGPYYTVVGPMNLGPAQGNGELFVNIGLPGTPSPLAYQYVSNNQINPHEFLFLVNGRDDNGDGYIDEGWDGIDNDLDGDVDNLMEWAGSWNRGWGPGESEQWLGSLVNANSLGAPWYYNLPYTITRRPTPSADARETMLPASVVVDMTTWSDNSPERSRLPVNPYTGHVDIMLSPQGEVLPNTIFSSPTSFTLADSYFHFWLAERSDLYNRSDFQVSGVPTFTDPTTQNTNPQYPPYLPTPAGLNPNTSMFLEGESRLLTLFTRNGRITINQISDFDTNPGDYNTAASGVYNYNPSLPLLRAQQGVRGGQ